MPNYKVYYFDIRGLGEPIRLALTQAGIPFEDVRVKMEDWPELKKKMPFGQMPVLEVDGKQLTQSMTIMRYIGSKHCLEAEDPWDRALADEVATSWLDIPNKLSGAWMEQDKEVKKKKFLEVIDDLIKPRLKQFDERISKSKSGFLAGDKVTWADFVTYNFLNMSNSYIRVSFEDYPNVRRYMEKIEKLPRIEAWQREHGHVPWTVFPSPFD